MTVTEKSANSLIFELAVMLDWNGIAEQTLLDHRPDGVRCMTCKGSAPGARPIWPCTMHRAAEVALRLEQARKLQQGLLE